MSNLSDFWLTEYDEWDFIDEAKADTDTTDLIDTDSQKQSEHTRHMIRLSSARRAIANYVSILTNQNIPVTFNDNNVNCTDGTHVFLSSDITKKDNFDVAVGLSLHEASHIKYSDFDMFKTIWMKVPRSIYDITEPLNISKDTVGSVCKDIFNYVEDRYIDYMVHTNAPGYRGYYDALYDKYFNAKVINDALESELYKTPSVESYMFRIINLTNPNTNLRALPGLFDIAKALNLSDIARLSKPQDRLDVALNIAEIVFKNIKEAGKQDMPTTIDNITGIGGDEQGKDDKNNVNVDDILGGQQTSVDQSNDKVSDIGDDKNISVAKKEKIKKAFDKQKDFIKGNIKKKKVTKKEKQVLDTLEKSKVELIDVAHDYAKGFGINGSIECILVKNMTKDLLFSDECPMYLGEGNDVSYKKNLDSVNQGIIMGTKLGRRLQIRNEINTYKFSRRYTGKLDKRLIHELGFSDENIFYTTLTEKYKKINLHISVDASTSMSGTKWDWAIKLCVAIAKAATMLDNINLTISFRTTTNRHPYILVAYDSKVDKFSKIRNLFPYLSAVGTTPEGLCFEAIMKYLPVADDSTNSYFVNMSDGEPYFSTSIDNQHVIHYGNEEAAKHTQNQVKKIRNNGYNVISYFINDGYINPNSKDMFKIMYGADANYINVENFVQIANTLNKKMMESLDI